MEKEGATCIRAQMEDAGGRHRQEFHTPTSLSASLSQSLSVQLIKARVMRGEETGLDTKTSGRPEGLLI